MTVVERIASVARARLGIDAQQLDIDAPIESLGVDSLDMIEFLFLLEDEFRVRFPENREGLSSFGDVVRFVEAALSTQAA